MSEKLESCPFCGGEASIGYVRWTGDVYKDCMPDLNRNEGWYGHCMTCLATMNPLGVGYETKEHAIRAWNRRTLPAGMELAPVGTREAMVCVSEGLRETCENFDQDFIATYGFQGYADKISAILSLYPQPEKDGGR